MFLHFLLLGALFSWTQGYFSEERSPEESKMQPPTVVIAILARNSAHSLPYYLGALERLNYPKDRISVWWVILLRAQALFQGTHAEGQPRLNGSVGAAAGGNTPPPALNTTILTMLMLTVHAF